MIRPKGLGRGLDALLAGVDKAEATDALQAIAIDRVQPGKYQPRTQMNDDALEELAAIVLRHAGEVIVASEATPMPTNADVAAELRY